VHLTYDEQKFRLKLKFPMIAEVIFHCTLWGSSGLCGWGAWPAWGTRDGVNRDRTEREKSSSKLYNFRRAAREGYLNQEKRTGELSHIQ
jgi:hypothetical protein